LARPFLLVLQSLAREGFQFEGNVGRLAPAPCPGKHRDGTSRAMRLCTVAQWDAMNNVGEVMSEDTDPVAALNAANALAAQVAAEKAQAELEEWKSPAAAAGRAAQQRADTAQAETSRMNSSFGQFAGAVPDLSKVSTGSTTVDTGTQLFGSALALQALGHASREAAVEIAAKITAKDKQVLVTTDADLASTDAMFAQVEEGLKQLLAAAQPLTSLPVSEPVQEDLTEGYESLVAGVGLAAAALPAVISLISANRKISGASVSADDTQATIGVAAAMAQLEPPVQVLMDDFRTVDTSGPISGLLASVSAQRLALAARKAELTNAASPGDSDSLAMVGEVGAAIDAFLASILAVPVGAARSAYTSAILRERLHDGSIACVVLVKGVGGSTAQVVNDRPLWFKDKFTTIASAGLSWLMVDPATAKVIAGGTKVSTLEITGTIGDTIKVKRTAALPA
jgi:hypothetical protein